MRFITSCAAAALLVSGHSFAQENGSESDEERLETVQVVGQTTTFGATKSEIPVLETPRSLTIISEDEFLEKGDSVLLTRGDVMGVAGSTNVLKILAVD